MIRKPSFSAGKDCAPPLLIEIEPVRGCNLTCLMCHSRYIPCEPQFLDLTLLDKLGDYSGWIVLGSSYEPLLHPKFDYLVNKLSERGCMLDLTTNATLLNKHKSECLAQSTLSNLTVSFDSIYADIYESVRRGANYNKTLSQLEYFNQIAGHEIFFGINAVLMRLNFREASEAVRFWSVRGVDQLRFVFMVVRFLDKQLLSESLYPIRYEAFACLDEAASAMISEKRQLTISSPYFHQSPLKKKFPGNINGHLVRSSPNLTDYFNPRMHYQKRSYPGMQYECSSPFTFARITSDGQVQLCYRFPVGNLHEATLTDIWHGKDAQTLRNRILSDPSICEYCDFRRYCLESRFIDLDRKENYFQEDLIARIKSFDFVN